MPKPPFISIPLDIAAVRVLKTELSKDGALILTVESTLDRTTCHRCGRTISAPYAMEQARLLRHLPILGRPVYLRIRAKRFRCPFCDDHPTTTQPLAWYDRKALHTNAFARHLIVQMINSTLRDVVGKQDVSYDALLGILDRWIATSVDWERIPLFSTLGSDELALTKGHRDVVAVLTARSTSGSVHLLAVLPDRLKTTVVAWLQTLPAARRAAIRTVCTDMWERYVTAVQEVLPQATVVIDRFHVARHYRQAVDDLRKTEVRRLRQALREAEQVHLKHTLWLFPKRAEELSEAEQRQRDVVLGYSPALKRAYQLREEVHRIFETARSNADGVRRLRFWRRRVARSGLSCFAGFLKLLDRWQDLIANYFIAHENSGFVEGLNNKLNVLKRRCYGLRNVGRLFQRLTLDLDGYRRFSPWAAAAH